MPTASELPDSLKDLPFYNAAEVRSGADFHPHVDRLIRAMEQIFRERGSLKPKARTVPVPRTWLILSGSALIGCVALLAFVSTDGLLGPHQGSDLPTTSPRDPAAPNGELRADNLRAEEPALGKEVTLAAKPIIYVKGTATWDTAFDTLVDAFKSVQNFVDHEKLKRAGPFMTIYTKTDDTGFEFEAALPLEEEPETAPKGDLSIGESPDGRALKFVHRGSYYARDATYDAITKYLDEKKLDAQDLFIEQYVSDPLRTPPENLVIDIFVPVK